MIQAQRKTLNKYTHCIRMCAGEIAVYFLNELYCAADIKQHDEYNNSATHDNASLSASGYSIVGLFNV